MNRCCYITFPTITAPDGRWRNSIEMVDRNGEAMGAYYKCYPTAGEMQEREFVTADINLDCCPIFLGQNHGMLGSGFLPHN